MPGHLSFSLQDCLEPTALVSVIGATQKLHEIMRFPATQKWCRASSKQSVEESLSAALGYSGGTGTHLDNSCMLLNSCCTTGPNIVGEPEGHFLGILLHRLYDTPLSKTTILNMHISATMLLEHMLGVATRYVEKLPLFLLPLPAIACRLATWGQSNK